MRRVVVLGALLLASIASTPTSASKIEHFVVLMLENRAFDHMCGWLKRKNPDIDGLTGKEFNVARGSKYYVNDTCPYVNPFDPNHSFEHTTRQVMGSMDGWVDPAPMDGFVKDALFSNFTEYYTVMHGFGPERVPTISSLAMEYAIFDKYYSALPGPTVPNRLFFHAGTPDGFLGMSAANLIFGFPQRTMMDVFNEANITWRGFYGDISDLLYLRSARSPQNVANLFPMQDFYTQAAEGVLPQYTFLSPVFYPLLGQQAQDQHPDHDVVEGEKLLARVYEALRQSPKWNKTALFLTYDEHGGFYDHVPPPQGVPSPDGKIGHDGPYSFNYTREGLRVCSVLISPLVPKGTVVHEAPTAQYEHSSIYKTLQNLFGFEEPPLSKRNAWAHPFDDLLSLNEPRTDCPWTVPTPENPPERYKAVYEEQRKRRPNGLQKELFALAEALHGRDGSDVDRFTTQEDMGAHVRHQHELFVEKQKAKLRD